jgi:hypothetical protein
MLFVIRNRRLAGFLANTEVVMTNLVWLNIPLGAIAFVATVGIPLRLVLTDPERNARRAGADQRGRRREHDYELAA